MADRESPRPSVEDAIDRAVREMMNVDAPPGFERRVMRRLTNPPVARFARPRLAVATAALALLVVAALLLRTTPEPVVPTEAPSVVTTRNAPASGTSPVPTPAPGKPSTGAIDIRERRAPRPTRERMVVAADTATAAVDAPAISSVAALEAPAALAVSTIEQRSVNVPDIRMSEIDIPHLNVEPLEPLEERSRE